ncbi:MAG: phage portal protein [Spirochaetaceae bacterium]|nr:phage portal protein [Spirochaetaceae bacterium]
MGLENFDENGYNCHNRYFGESFLTNAWVNIAVNLIVRNIARANFVLSKNGEVVNHGPLYDLFRRPSKINGCYDLWKETTAWFLIEGEAFWYFGDGYTGGIPQELIVLNPRKVITEGRGQIGVIDNHCSDNNIRWFYQTDSDTIPILHDEFIHFKEWNPFNPIRGINPLIPLALELEQDYYANRANNQLLKNNAIPMGILKTDQTLRSEEADAIERRWESKYSQTKANRKIAVLGKGTNFEPLAFSPDVVKLFELKRWNLFTILAKYGIPPRVANVIDKNTSLSGKDTKEQHAAFWKYTLVPLLKQFEAVLESQFFMRFGLKERCYFSLTDIPELQDSEDEQSKRDIAEINAGLKTINDVLCARGMPTKPWGDNWYRPQNLVPYGKEN